MGKELRHIMWNIKAHMNYEGNYKIVTVFLLTPQDVEGNSFTMDIIAGVKKEQTYNDYTKIFYNESMPFTVEEFKGFLLEAYDKYRIEAIIPDNWRKVNKFWWETIENELEIIYYATSSKDWKYGKIGFKIIQKF